MSLINCKVELKFKWAKQFVLAAAGFNNVNANDDNVIFIVNNTNLCVPVVTLSANDNQKLSKRLSKGSERWVYWNEWKTKSENKNTTYDVIYFLKSNVLVVNRFFVCLFKSG